MEANNDQAQQSDKIRALQEDTEASKRRVKVLRQKAVIANTCLLVWAILLAVIGMQAVSGKASTMILDLAQTLTFRHDQGTTNRLQVAANQGSTVAAPVPGSTNCPPVQGTSQNSDGATVLDQYIQTKYRGQNETAIPPIAVVLDRLQVSINWRDAKEIDNANGLSVGAPGWNDYCNLFDIVAKRLEAIADFSPEVAVGNTLKISNNIMPSRFRSTDVEIRSADGKQPLQKFQKFQEQDIDLPVEATLWVKARQSAIASRKSQISFLDLFILLIILGGFGSWIYLVRRHINPNIPVDLSEYFYRPPLGMALAIAVFIVNLTVHSFVSTSNITEVRRETLILLAFAAGLLSDKTYDFIEKVTGEKLGSATGKPELPPAQTVARAVLPGEKQNDPHAH